MSTVEATKPKSNESSKTGHSAANSKRLPYKVKDISLAEFGRKEIEIAETTPLQRSPQQASLSTLGRG